ncbi:MAG TPA: hypothetical protein VL651_04125 [Bacteroidia bacterium]|jgi:hypothetical protein|nr:hypothetical protein [Bacteroidia bacterium]
MKKNFLLLLSLFTTCFCFSQNDQAQNYKWAVGLQLNTIERLPDLGNGSLIDERFYLGSIEKNKSFSIGVPISKRINENLFFRTGLSWTHRNIIEDAAPVNPSGDYVINHAQITQSIIKISPGILWGESQNKIMFYGGFILPVTIYGTTKITEHTDSYSADTISYMEDGIISIPNGISVGIGSLSGFSIRINQHLCVGSEISFAYAFSKIGDGETELTRTSLSPGGSPQTTTLKWNDSIQRVGIFDMQGSISFSFTF